MLNLTRLVPGPTDTLAGLPAICARAGRTHHRSGAKQRLIATMKSAHSKRPALCARRMSAR